MQRTYSFKHIDTGKWEVLKARPMEAQTFIIKSLFVQDTIMLLSLAWSCFSSSFL